MKTKLKLVLLTFVAALALYMARSAFMTLRAGEDELPSEVYAQFNAKMAGAEYILRLNDGYVTVYRNGRSSPEIVTDIESAVLRRADEAMLEKGIPANDLNEVLTLLEDLGT